MTDETTGSPPGEGPPTTPPPMPPPMPPPPVSQPQGPPSYPTYPAGTGPGGPGPGGPGGGYAPPPGQYPYAPPSYGGPTGSPYAGWGIRLGGWLIDFVILLVVQLIIGAALRKSNALTLHFTAHLHNGTVRHDRIDFLALLITAIIAIVYATVLIGGRGQTVGMMAVGIKAVPDGTPAGAVGPGKAFGRALLEQLFRLTVVVWVLSMLWPLWDGKNQTLHDKAVGTVVLRVRSTG